MEGRWHCPRTKMGLLEGPSRGASGNIKSSKQSKDHKRRTDEARPSCFNDRKKRSDRKRKERRTETGSLPGQQQVTIREGRLSISFGKQDSDG